MYDLIIIGGGPGGYMAAELAGRGGLSVLLAEKRTLGGVCLNEGCIPSKTLLHSAKVFDYASHGAAYGVYTEKATLDHKFVVSRKNHVVATLVNGVKSLMRASKVKVVNGEAYIIDGKHVKVNDEIYETKRLLIATGSAPVIPQIDGLSQGIKKGFVLTSREIFELEEIPERLTVIGGGVIGLEMAAYFNSAGSKVTVVEMLPKIGGPIDSDISGILLKNCRQKGICFELSARLTGITENSVIYDTGETEADKVLLSIGRKPVTEGFGLENTGVAVRDGAILTDRYCQTGVPDIYAAGDVNGKYMLAHTAYREAAVAVNHILGKPDIMRYDAIPMVIYTSPEVACVGETEESAKAKGIKCETASVPMRMSGR